MNFKKFVRHAALCVSCIAVIAGFAGTASAEGAGGKKLVVIVADNVGFNDWATPTLKVMRGIEERGALGIMVSRSEAASPRDGSTEIESGAYLTLGSGLSAEGDANGPLAFNADELFENRPAGTTYSVRTGRKEPDSGIVHLGIGAFQQKNAETQWMARPGALGELLKSNGVRTAVVGNSDLFGRFERGAVIIAMDEDGQVDVGDVSADLVLQDNFSPMGYRTDVDKLKNKFLDVETKADFIVIYYGDMNRVDRFGISAAAAEYAKAKEKTLGELGVFVKWVVSKVDLSKTQILVVVPTPPRGASRQKDTLTPMFAMGAGIGTGPAILTSQSTRRPGIVKNTDFAPHVCAFFGIAPAPDFIGSPLEVMRNEKQLAFLKVIHDRDVLVESQIGFLKGIIIWHLVVLLVGFLTTLRLEKAAKWWRMLMTVIILYTASMFLAFLLLGGFPQITDPVLYLLAFFGLAALIAIAAGIVPGFQWKMFTLAALYIVTLVADQLTGAQLIKYSVLGYYPQLGARFYGIGNEFMGFLVGAPILLSGLLLDATKDKARRAVKACSIVFFLAITVVVGAPFIGANFGGLISCLFGFLIMTLLIAGGKLNWKMLVGITVAVVAMCGVVVFIDMHLGGGESHVARMMDRIFGGGGGGEFLKVVFRKLSVNLRLLRVSFWSALFVVTLAVTLAGHYFPVDRITKLFNKNDFFRKSYLAALGGAIAAFLFNDSGIVPATTSLILPTASMFILLFNQPEKQQKGARRYDGRHGNRKQQESGARSIVLKQQDKDKIVTSVDPGQKPKQGQGQQQRPQQPQQKPIKQPGGHTHDRNYRQENKQGGDNRQQSRPQQGQYKQGDNRQQPRPQQNQQHKPQQQKGSQPPSQQAGGQQGDGPKKSNRNRRRRYYRPPGGPPKGPQGGGGEKK